MQADRSSSRDHTPSLRFANRPPKHGESHNGHIECADYISDISLGIGRVHVIEVLHESLPEQARRF
jgi:hypothetical protein